MLDQNALKTSLENVFASMPANPGAAAAALASAYADYADDGLFGTSTTTIDSDRIDAMASTLEQAIDNPLLGAPATFAGAWAAAIATFWTTVPVVGTQVGATTGCPGASSLTGSLATVFANLANTAETCAAGIAAALHSATQTVTATVSPPANTVLGIT